MSNATNKSNTQTRLFSVQSQKKELTNCSSGLTPGSQRAKGLSCSSSGKDPLSSKAWTTTKAERNLTPIR